MLDEKAIEDVDSVVNDEDDDDVLPFLGLR